jgi:hypothetical protein
MDKLNIQYAFKIDQQRREVVDLQLDPQTLELPGQSEDELPFWAKLDFHQCPHCPLDPSQHSACPVAATLVDIVERFENVMSYDELELEVTTSVRHVFQRTSAQRAISSLLGILFPASGCPHTAFFKPMVRFHLPLANEEETIFRASSMFLLAQYFLRKKKLSEALNFKGLQKIYENMNLLNMNVAERLRNASCTESSINAIVLLDVFAFTMPLLIEDQLDEIRHLFIPFFPGLSET